MDVSQSTIERSAKVSDGTGVIELDPWLSPFKDQLQHRFSTAQNWIKTLKETEGGLEKFSRVVLQLLSPHPIPLWANLGE